MPAQIAERLDLCSTEVVTNIITHGYTDHAMHWISLQLHREGEHVALEIQDEGIAFDPRQLEDPQPAASIEEAKVGGLGIKIMRRFSDELRYRHAHGRNYLTLIFRLSQTGTS